METIDKSSPGLRVRRSKWNKAQLVLEDAVHAAELMHTATINVHNPNGVLAFGIYSTARILRNVEYPDTVRITSRLNVGDVIKLLAAMYSKESTAGYAVVKKRRHPKVRVRVVYVSVPEPEKQAAKKRVVPVRRPVYNVVQRTQTAPNRPARNRELDVDEHAEEVYTTKQRSIPTLDIKAFFDERPPNTTMPKTRTDELEEKLHHGTTRA